jgi:ABC-2 type transport system permease protein
VHAALTYLAVRSIRNGFAIRLRRLRRPRYLLIAIGGVLYFGSMMFNRSRLGDSLIPEHYRWMATIGLGALIALTMVLTWVLPGAAALRFTAADAQFLFPAPLSRRELLGYKIVRLLTAALGLPLFLTVIAGPVHAGPAIVFYLKAAAAFGVIALHEAAVSLYRVNARNGGGLTGRRRIVAIAANALLISGAAFLLARFAFASSRELAFLAPLVMIVIAAQVAWILRSDTAFEEEATVAAERVRAALARGQRPRIAAAPGASTPFALAPRGPAETAILWKNWMLLSRASAKQWIVPLSVVLAMAGGIAVAGYGGNEPIAGAMGYTLTGMVALMGPAMLRIDLRQDLANLALIKTWPIEGPAIVRGEVLAPAIALSGGAAAGLLLSAIFAPQALLPSSGDVTGRAAFFLTGTALVCAVIVAELVIQNGIAAMFPAWVRVTPGAVQPGSVEMMGQSMVVMYGGILVLLIAAIAPAAAAAVVWFMTKGTLVPAGIFAVLLAIESYAATEIVGRILDRVDLQDVTVAD